MLGPLSVPVAPLRSVADARRQHWRSSRWIGAGCILGTGLFAAMALSTAPQPFSLGILIFLGVVATCVVRPKIGLSAAIALAAFGDPATSAWYPFTKNFSSHESMLFLSDQAIVTPLEVCIAALLFGLILQRMSARVVVPIQRGALFWPLAAFTGFVLLGFVNGVSHGGDTTAALYEVRGILYLPVIYF